VAIEIREAGEADAPALARLLADLYGADRPSIPVERVVEILRRMRAYPDYRVYVACAGGAVVGMYALLVMDNFARQGTPSAVVEDVVVAVARRRKGIGRALMEDAMRRAWQAGCYKLALTSNVAREDAHRFYEALGFRKHGLAFLVEKEHTT
jgi:GNAT superfamily N-acetyltransferase